MVYILEILSLADFRHLGLLCGGGNGTWQNSSKARVVEATQETAKEASLKRPSSLSQRRAPRRCLKNQYNYLGREKYYVSCLQFTENRKLCQALRSRGGN